MKNKCGSEKFFVWGLASEDAWKGPFFRLLWCLFCVDNAYTHSGILKSINIASAFGGLGAPESGFGHALPVYYDHHKGVWKGNIYEAMSKGGPTFEYMFNPIPWSNWHHKGFKLISSHNHLLYVRGFPLMKYIRTSGR